MQGPNLSAFVGANLYGGGPPIVPIYPCRVSGGTLGPKLLHGWHQNDLARTTNYTNHCNWPLARKRHWHEAVIPKTNIQSLWIVAQARHRRAIKKRWQCGFANCSAQGQEQAAADNEKLVVQV